MPFTVPSRFLVPSLSYRQRPLQVTTWVHAREARYAVPFAEKIPATKRFSLTMDSGAEHALHAQLESEQRLNRQRFLDNSLPRN